MKIKDEYPKKIYVQGIHSDSQEACLFKESFEKSFGRKIMFQPLTKRLEQLVALNINQVKENFNLRQNEKNSKQRGLKKLQSIFKLKELPSTIESLDIAIFQGKSPTAAQVCFIDGKSYKNNYRHYHLSELKEGNNDFAMMKEVAARRVKSQKLPDIFIVDGGLGQVNAFKKGLGVDCLVPVLGIIKSKTKSNFDEEKIRKTEERLVIPGRKEALGLLRLAKAHASRVGLGVVVYLVRLSDITNVTM